MLKVIIFLLFLVYPFSGFAFYDNENFFDSKQVQPAWFEMDGYGGFYGETTDGTTFTQSVIANDAGLRVHKFLIGSAFFYISDKGIIRADNDLSAISIYFTLS